MWEESLGFTTAHMYLSLKGDDIKYQPGPALIQPPRRGSQTHLPLFPGHQALSLASPTTDGPLHQPLCDTSGHQEGLVNLFVLAHARLESHASDIIHPSIHVSVHWSIHSSINPSVHLSIHSLSIHSFTHLSNHPFSYASVHSFIHSFTIHPSICLSVH